MEIFRRLGIASAVREAGLPPEYPNDVAFRTTATGVEFARISIPCRAERYTAKNGQDTWWPTPEPPHRINQIYLEPVMFAHAATVPRLRILSRTSVLDFEQTESGVLAIARDLDTNKTREIFARYLVGCDGAHSKVRHRIGAALSGDSHVMQVQSTYILAPSLLGLMPGPAWAIDCINPRACGLMFAIDGRERWLIHHFLRGHASQPLEGSSAAPAIAAFGRSSALAPTSRSRFSARRTGLAGGCWPTVSAIGGCFCVATLLTSGCPLRDTA
jgi:2-polyprenyl-6-methoxyphenol hydroxylase-like FAD-dependent oxidoreductase